MPISQPTGVVPPPGRVPEVWGKVPQRNKNFTGRDGLLEKLHAAILTDVTAVVPHALHGLGGVGKTQVAIEYAYRYRSEYDLVWWIPADQPVLVRSSLASLAPHLGLPPTSVTGIEDAASAVLDALRKGEPFMRWLLIFDNADQPEDINEILPRGPGHVLITSRNHRWEGVVDTLSVDVFSRQESVAFLNRRIARAMSAQDADRLAEELGDLPLALEQAAALQAETGMSVEEYLRLLRERTARLLAEGKPSEYPQSMTAVWALSVSQLAEKLPEAVDVLRCCAFFGPEPIPRDVFALNPADTGPRGLNRLLSDPILLSRAIREMGRYALATVDSRNRTIQVHRLIQALIRDELSLAEHNRIRHEVHLLLAAAGPPDPDDVRLWPRYQELVAHVRPAFLAACTDPQVREFARRVVRFLYSSGDFETARSYVEDLIARWKDDSGPEAPDLLIARRLLGDVLRELGEYPSAYQLNRNTLTMMRRALGPEHRETLRVANSHGADMRARGEFTAALRHDLESRRMHEEVFGPWDPRTLRTVNNLAVDYGLISDYSTARQLHEEAYLHSGPGSKVSRLDVVSSLNGLARIVRLIGNYGEACDLGEDAHGMGVQDLGPEHHWTLRTAKDLSIAQRRAGLIEEGFELAQETYERERRVFGVDHPDSLAAAMNLANALRAVGRTEEALAMARDTTVRYAPMYGQTHPYNYGCAINLALLLRVHGDVEEARQVDLAALAGLEATVGRDHHYTLTCAVNLASDLADLGDNQGAREIGEDTLPRLATLLGADHPLTLACTANLAIDLLACGALDEGERIRAEVFGRYTQILSPEHPDVVVALNEHRLDFDFDPQPI